MSRLGVAVIAAASFFAGVLLVAVLGGAKNVVHEKTVTVPSSVTTNGGTVITKTVVPDLIGQPLDLALDRLDRAGFEADVDGGGVLGILVAENWEVVDQSPPGGEMLEQGSTVSLVVQHS